MLSVSSSNLTATAGKNAWRSLTAGTGDGRLVMLETADNSTIDLNLVLDRVWRNEAARLATLQASVFDASGFGTLTLIDNIDGARTGVATVNEAT